MFAFSRIIGQPWRKRARTIVATGSAVALLGLQAALPGGAAAAAPQLGISQSVVVVPEGGTATNTGSFFDIDFQAVQISTSVGTVTQSGGYVGTWSWSMPVGDGVSPMTSQEVRVTARDRAGESRTGTFVVQVENVAPSADFVLPPIGEPREGHPFTLKMENASDPSAQDQAAGFQYAFDCGDGRGYSAWSAANSIVCPVDNNEGRDVKGAIRDKDGGTRERTGWLYVSNEYPTAEFIYSRRLDEGQTIGMALINATDPSSVDRAEGYIYRFSCDNAVTWSAWSSTSNFFCPTTDNGDRMVWAAIKERNGEHTGRHYQGRTIIDNVAPTANVYAPVQAAVGETINVWIGDVFEPSAADRAAGLTYVFDCGAGEISGGDWQRSCVVPDQRTLLVKGKVIDKDGGMNTYSRPVIVTNASPYGTVVIDDGAEFTRLAKVTLSMTAVDPAPGSGLAAMRLSNDGTAWSEWLPIAPTRVWTLAGGNGLRTVYAQFRDANGNESAVVSDTITRDATAPRVTAPMHQLVPSAVRATSEIVVDVTWPAATDSGSGVAGYELQQSDDGGTNWTTVARLDAATRRYRARLAPGAASYRFQLSAVDRVGNVSTFVAGPTLGLHLDEENSPAVNYGGAWKAKARVGSSGGQTRQSASAGAVATYSFVGRSVALVAPRHAAGGQAEVRLDGVLQTTLDLYSAGTQQQRIVFAADGLNPAQQHTLEVRVLGTKNPASTDAMVEIDAFLVAR